MLRSVAVTQKRLLDKVLERVERCQGSKPDKLLEARIEEAHGGENNLGSLALHTSFYQAG